VRVCMDENSDGAARVAHVSSAIVRGSWSEYGVSSVAGGKRKGFDRLRLRDQHWERPLFERANVERTGGRWCAGPSGSFSAHPNGDGPTASIVNPIISRSTSRVMRLVGMQVRWVLALLLLCRPALAQGPVVTASLDFTVGSVDSGAVHGFVAPGGRFELGVALGPLRLQAEFEGALWSLEHRKTESGSWSRTGVSLRWYWRNLGGGMRVYSEAGIGRHHLALSEIEVARNDVALGVGLVEQISVGGWQLGVRMGVRALVMNSPGARPQDALVCRGGCPMPANQNADLGLMMVMGLELGK
jgi:hypothetical protein